MGDQTAMQWLLVIEGIPQAFLSHGEAALPSDVFAGTLQPGAIVAERVRPNSADEVNIQESLSRGGSWRVGLSIRWDNVVDSLLNFSDAAATKTLELAENIEQITASSITRDVTGDLTDWGAGDVAYIGMEAMLVTGKGAGTLTLTRSYAGSRAQSHTVLEEKDGGAPAIYDVCTRWARRGARLFYADTRGTPSASDWVEVCRGYLREEPEEEEQAATVSLVVCPWQDALTLPLEGAGQETTFTPGEHLFDGQNAGVVHIGTHEADRGGLFRKVINTVTGGVNVYVAWKVHQGWFNPAAALRAQQGWCWLSGNVYQPAAAGTYVGVGGGYDPATDYMVMASAVGANNQAEMENEALIYAAEVSLYDSAQVVSWPGAFVDDLNEEMAYAASGATVGATWLINHAIVGDGRFLSCTGRGTEAPSDGPSVRFRTPFDQPKYLWYGFSTAPVGTDVVPDRTRSQRIQDKRKWPTPNKTTITAYRGAESSPEEVEIRGLAIGFYQTGELFLYLADDLSSGGGPGRLSVVWQEHDGTQRGPVTISYTEVESALSKFGSGTGYVYTLADPSNTPSIGSWPGQDPAVFRPGAAWDDSKVKTVLLELLMSSEGNGERDSTYDKQAFGLGLTADELDVDSIEDADWAYDQVDYFCIEEALTLEKVIGSMLRLNGHALVTRLIDQRRVLSLVPVSSVPVRGQSVLTIEDGDWTTSERPSRTVDRGIENTLEVQTAADRVTREDGPLITLRNVKLYQARGRRAEVHDEDAPWLRVYTSDSTLLTSAAKERWAIFGQPRVVISGSISAGQAKGLAVGDILTLSARLVRTYVGRGISEALGRVVLLDFDPQGSDAQIEVNIYRNEGVGWSPSMEVLSVTSTTVVEVRENWFAEVVNPWTREPQTDPGFFASSDKVYGFTPADWGSGSNLVIQSISGTTITFTAAHGLSAGDLITAQDHGQNPDTLDAYAAMDVGDLYA